MTERASKPSTERKGRRPHPARNARLISTGAAASLTLGMVAALAISDASAASRASAEMVVEQPTAELAPVSTLATPTPATIMVIRRIHYLPSATTVAPTPAADAVVFSPQPAVRASAAAVAPRKTSTVRRAVVKKRQAPARVARRATKAS